MTQQQLPLDVTRHVLDETKTSELVSRVNVLENEKSKLVNRIGEPK